jgi:predicted PurR-regulated permease PerM
VPMEIATFFFSCTGRFNKLLSRSVDFVIFNKDNITIFTAIKIVIPMNSRELSNGILRAVGTLAAIAVVLYFLFKIQSVLIYIAVALVLTLIASPFLKFFHAKLKLPKTISVVLVMAIFIAVIFGILAMFIPVIIHQGHQLSLLNADGFINNIRQVLKGLEDYLTSKGIHILKNSEEINLGDSLKSLPGALNTVLGFIGSFSMGLVSVFFIAFFLMKDERILKNAFKSLVPNDKEDRILKSVNEIRVLLSRYFIGLIIQIFILFALYSIVLLIFRVDNAVVIAFLCALLNLIPYLGPLIGGILMITLTMTSNIEQDFSTYILPTTIYVLIGYIVAQWIDNFLSQPIIFSKSVKSHPLEIFLVIIIGGLLFGITGMVIAVPIYTAIKVILKEFLADNQIVKNLTKGMD